jgi:hypothetical protein
MLSEGQQGGTIVEEPCSWVSCCLHPRSWRSIHHLWR